MWMIRLRPIRVPARRRVFDQVVADRDDEIGAIEARQDVVAGLQPDRHQREVASVVDRALAHERHRDRDVETLGEGPEFGRRVAAQDAVAGQHQRPTEATRSRAACSIASSVGSGK